MTLEWELVASLLVGIGLSAACGLRLFIPPLVLSALSLYFHIPIPQPLQWLGSEAAFFILLAATLFEIGAYYVPWLDHLLDTAAAPMAVIAGTLITGTFLNELDPVWRWSLALIAGGTAAGTVQSLSSVTRLASLGLTGGLANPMVATLENGMSLIISAVVIAFPIITLVILGLVAWGALTIFRKLKRPSQPS